MNEYGPASIVSEGRRINPVWVVCALGFLTIVYAGYLRVEHEGARLGLLSHEITEVRRPALEDYQYRKVLGMTLSEMKAELKAQYKRDKRAGIYRETEYWDIWPNYVYGGMSVCHTGLTDEFLVTNGRISAIRWTSKYMYSNLTEQDEWIDGNGRYHPELRKPETVGEPEKLTL